jgi:hypothetical protein
MIPYQYHSRLRIGSQSFATLSAKAKILEFHQPHVDPAELLNPVIHPICKTCHYALSSRLSVKVDGSLVFQMLRFSDSQESGSLPAFPDRQVAIGCGIHPSKCSMLFFLY